MPFCSPTAPKAGVFCISKSTNHPKKYTKTADLKWLLS